MHQPTFRPTTIVVGSLNRAKLAATRRVMARHWPNAVVKAVAAPSAVAVQPCGDEETAAGAANRARAAAELRPDANLTIGLEGGAVYREALNAFFITAWAAVLRPATEELSYGHGGLVPLPLSWRARLAAGEELGPLVESLWGDVANRQQGGAVAALTFGTVQRVDYLARAVQFALVPLLHPDLYTP